MIVNDLIKHIENWAPKEAALPKDNPGLQVGSSDRGVTNIFLCLELTGNALEDAIKKKCNFIFTHHPFIFQPLKKIDVQNDKNAQLIEILIKNNITLYSAHTNLDSAKNGVSFQLSKELGLKNIQFLENLENNQYKLVVFLPSSKLEEVSSAIFNAGGGIIGEYEKCSFRINGHGSFEGSENSNPSIGEPEKFEKVEEVRLEVLVNSWKLKKVISEMIKAHPYEEPAYDIYPLANKNVNCGFGAIGELETPMQVSSFLEYVYQKLNLKNFRYSAGKNNLINKIAVCGGSGTELLNTALSKGADAFITADIKYHTFHDALDRILLIDAGHYETEVIVLKEVKRRLELFTKNELEIFLYQDTTNPVTFYKY
jgi:dinuclear metal center YbgI/SA1388 family protein